jgi:nucleoside triphosphate pyrophosphatase
VVLASASPRRSALLQQIGVAHRIVPAQLEERREQGESITQCVLRLAQQKALQVYQRTLSAPPGDGPPLPVLGADTAVVIDGAMLGKPRDREQALAMLARLSGREHEVLSAVAIVYAAAAGYAVCARLSRSAVRMRVLTEDECSAYWHSGEPCDKAGGYAIQGRGALFVEALQGSYSGVMGLPLFETAALLAAAGVPLWQA